MTPKEKSNEIINLFTNTDLSDMGDDYVEDDAKECSKICVTQQLKLLEFVYGYQKQMWTSHENETYKYWQDVKRHIVER